MIPGVETTAVHVVREPRCYEICEEIRGGGGKKGGFGGKKGGGFYYGGGYYSGGAVTTVSAAREARWVDTTGSGLMKSCVKPSVKVAAATATVATTVAITMATAVVERFYRVYPHPGPCTRLGDRTRTVTKCVPKHVSFLVVVRTDIACFFILRRILPFFFFFKI